MSNDKIVELGRHAPTPQSICSRLSRHKDEIKSISAIVTWHNDDVGVFFEDKTHKDLAYELKVFEMKVSSQLKGE